MHSTMTKEGLEAQFPAIQDKTLAIVASTPQPNGWLWKLKFYRNIFMDNLRHISRINTHELSSIGDTIGQEVGLNYLEQIFFNMAFVKHIALEQIDIATRNVAVADRPQRRRALHAADSELEDHTKGLSEGFVLGFEILGVKRNLTEQWFEAMERAGAHTASAMMSGNPKTTGETIFSIVSRIIDMRNQLGISDLELQLDMVAISKIVFGEPESSENQQSLE